MPNKKYNKKTQPVANVSTPTFNTIPLNDFTNLQLLLQQQSQILALNETIRQQEKASSSTAGFDDSANTSPEQAPSHSLSPTPTLIRTSKSSNRWTSAEIRVLIKEVGEHQQALQKVKDPREKGRIWDKIVSNIQTSSVASPVLKERSKASIQQKWDAVFQKYRDIKDTIACTGEEPIQDDWEFYNDIDEYLRNDPSVQAPIISDSIRGIKHKMQDDSTNDKNDDHNDDEQPEQITPKRKNRKVGGGKENVIEEFQSFIKEQTETIIEAMDRQHLRTTEIQQKQHEEQLDIFKQFLLKF